MRQTMAEIFCSWRCIFASVRCCLGMCYRDRCHWRGLTHCNLRLKLSFWNHVCKGVMSIGRSILAEGGRGRREVALGEPLGRAGGAVVAVCAVCHCCCRLSDCWPLRVNPGNFRVIKSSKTDGKGSWQIWIRWWELGCSIATLAGKVLLVQTKLNNFFFPWCHPEHKASPCYSSVP